MPSLEDSSRRRSATRRPTVLATGLATLVTGLATGLATLALGAAPALASGIAPEAGGSPNANRIHGLYMIVLVFALIVFVIVEGALLYSVLRFRAGRRTRRRADQVHGNTRLEIGWTIAAAAIVLALVGITFAKLSSIKNADPSGPDGLNATLVAAVGQPPPTGGPRLTIDVNGQQFIWRYTYPNGAYSYETMVVPTNTTVLLNIRSQDVAHSWWIPKLGGKADAFPGYVNHTWFKISKPGDYHGQCALLCGRHHANMVADVHAVPPDVYTAWVNDQRQLIAQANQLAAQQRATLSPIPSQ